MQEEQDGEGRKETSVPEWILSRRILKTTTERQVIEQPNVKTFLARKARNSKGTARTYGLGLASMQEFLNINKYGIELNDISPSFFNEKTKTTVYELIDGFIDYLHTTRGLARNTIHLYVEAVKGYFDHRDIEISSTKYKKRVTLPKKYTSEEAAIDRDDIRKILLACHNFRLKVFLLLLASGGFRAREALSLRLKDIDFSVRPTRIHIREEMAKSRTARDVYISEEATSYLKQFIERKYTVPVQYRVSKTGEYVSFLRTRNENDLIFQMVQKEKENRLTGLYNKMMLQFQQLLKVTGLEQRKQGGGQSKGRRRVITFHSFRRYVKTVLSDQTNTDFSEFFLGHADKSTYYRKKEPERRLMYATKCEPFLTFLNYTQLEQDATVKQTEMEMLQIKDANKDREIELLKQKIQAKEKEIELLKQRDTDNTNRLDKLETELGKVSGFIGIKSRFADTIEQQKEDFEEIDKLVRKGVDTKEIEKIMDEKIRKRKNQNK